ncbi:MAG: PAS domain S-box protein [Bacteroidota bacterium]|nr:PAS domain S-box protein [Bacteroidota bacterium]
MGESIIIGLVQNIAILLTFSMLYDFFWSRNEKLNNNYFKIGSGIILGGIGIVLILTPWHFIPGVFFDTRSVMLSIAGLFFGPVPTITAMIIAGLYRLYVGGAGAMMGIAVVLTSGSAGLFWWRFRPNWRNNNPVIELAAMGFLVHVVMLCCTIFLPGELSWQTLKNIALPVIVIYPIATILLGMLMLNQAKNRENRIALDNSEKRWHFALEGAGDGVWDWNPQTNVVFFSKQWKLMLGYEVHEIENKLEEWDKRLFPDDKETVYQLLNQHIDGLAPVYISEHRIMCKDGTYKWILARGKIMTLDADGKPIRFIGTNTDISERKEAEEKLLRERKLLRTLIDNLPATIYVKDTECRKIIANRADMEVIGAKTEEEVLGKTDMEIFSNDIGARGYADDKRLIETGIPVLNQEECFYDANGIQHWLLTSKIPLTDENGKITGLVGIGHHITEQRKMQAELVEAKEKAEESDRLKSAFLANMSHEIRTPLNSIIGFSELLDDPDFDSEQKTEFIKHIVDNGNSLLMIISDIMDFSMLEAGQLKLRQQPISVKKIMNELFSEYSHKAETRGIQLRFDDSPNDPDILITSDSYRIKQVFNNLIGNSLKFTSEGFIEIGYKAKGEKIEFHVKDSGIGISPKFHQAIFERFRQVDTTKSRKYGGNGLGLAISKNLVQLLGGKIWLKSEPDKYSDFFFTIPI